MVSEDEGAFLFKLKLMEGYKAPTTIEFCSVNMPFPRRKIVLIDGNPSVGTVSTTEHSVDWKIIVSGRSVTAKSLEATFPGTIKFAPKTINRHSYTSNLKAEAMHEEEIEKGKFRVKAPEMTSEIGLESVSSTIGKCELSPGGSIAWEF